MSQRRTTTTRLKAENPTALNQTGNTPQARNPRSLRVTKATVMTTMEMSQPTTTTARTQCGTAVARQANVSPSRTPLRGNPPRLRVTKATRQMWSTRAIAMASHPAENHLAKVLWGRTGNLGSPRAATKATVGGQG